jgi:hypothetical protein
MFESRTALPLITHFPYDFYTVAGPGALIPKTAKEFIKVIGGVCRFRGSGKGNDRLVRPGNRNLFRGNNGNPVKTGFYRVHKRPPSFTLYDNYVFRNTGKKDGRQQAANSRQKNCLIAAWQLF